MKPAMVLHNIDELATYLGRVQNYISIGHPWLGCFES